MFPQPKRAQARLTFRDRVRDRPAYDSLSDLVLAVRAKDGDERALEALVERHAPGVRRLTAYLLADTQDAEDAAQEALAKLCVRLRQFRGDSQFATWFHRLVVNTCLDVAARQQSRRCEPLAEDAREAADGDPARETALAELRHELRTELAELSHEQASVVVLKDALGFSFAEISARSGMPVGTAKCYAHRARAGLRARLTDETAA